MPSRARRGLVSRPAVLAVFLVLGLVAAGCADVSEHEQFSRAEWEPEPPPPAVPDNAPRFPDEQPGVPAPETSATEIPPPDGCVDYDPAVVATCLEPVSGVAVLPDGEQALVAERATGRIIRVRWGLEPEDKSEPEAEFATLDVDASEGGGGLLGIALSPNYAEDSLLYAYLSTPEDNRVVRIAAGDEPKPVLTGLPRDPMGALGRDLRGALLVATGSTADPAAATDPESLAGKLLRIDGYGAPAADNPDPETPVITSGLVGPAGLCQPMTGETIWVTDRAEERDLLYQVDPGSPLGEPAWNWPERPGVAGCAAWADMLLVFTSDHESLINFDLGPESTFINPPRTTVEGEFGRFSAAAAGVEDYVWVGTENKDGAEPTSSDDRVILIDRVPTGSEGGKD
ncbi:PQQ-dependent sugar dehydrogenase [Actinoalloteichus hymeniacidonis]|nr:PQQ-dependent sugar dehydrogenase [Actinoalloteichus hymeniacidonis]MBB5906574.1 glucose/arabinose dehydrogenase [Actinoalloteichus hymeniacidonis]